jgi:hypothetical protein
MVDTQVDFVERVARHQGAVDERNRIIEMLTPFLEHNCDTLPGLCFPQECSVPIYEHIISLIKGD